MNKLIYNKIDYPSDHWAVSLQESEKKYFVRYVKEKSYDFRVMLNPTDCRGYRSIIT